MFTDNSYYVHVYDIRVQAMLDDPKAEKLNLPTIRGFDKKQSSTRIVNAIFHLSALARFPALYCLSMIQGTAYLVMDSMIELNDYYQYH